MTTATLINNLYHCGFCTQVSTYFANWKASIADKIKNHNGARQLEDMSDHALKDIGITRGDITAIRHGELAHHYRGHV